MLSSCLVSIQKSPDLPERVKPPHCQCPRSIARGHTKEAATGLMLTKALHTSLRPGALKRQLALCVRVLTSKATWIGVPLTILPLQPGSHARVASRRESGPQLGYWNPSPEIAGQCLNLLWSFFQPKTSENKVSVKPSWHLATEASTRGDTTERRG